MQNSRPIHRSLSSLAESQDRVLDAFWQDTPPAAAQPAPYRGLIESLQIAGAALSSEREDIAASQRLAERFVRQPAPAPAYRQPPVRAQAPSIRPYIVAAAFMMLVTGGTAFNFLGSGAVPKRAPDGIANAAAVAPAGEDVLDSLDERDAPASRAFVPSQPVVGQGVFAEPSGSVRGVPASDRASDESWASTVETLRLLSAAKNAPQQVKAGQPVNGEQLLQQFEAWRANKNR